MPRGCAPYPSQGKHMKKKLRQALPDILIALFLLIVPLAFFLQQTIGGRTLVPTENLFQFEPYRSLATEYGAQQPHNMLYSDLVLENVEWRLFVSRQVAERKIPLWQPNILAGSPFIAAGQGLTLYPFSLLFLMLPPASAYGWFTVLQLWIAAINMYVLVRVLGIRRPGALMAALAYQLSGTFMGSVVFPMILAGAAWLPLLLAMIELVVRQAPVMGRPSSLPWALIGAVGLGMVVLAGHVEVLYFTLLVMGFYAAWRLVAGTVGTHHAVPLRGKMRWLAVRAVWMLALVGMGLALGAVQLIPSYELASRSFREGAVTYQQMIEWAYPKRHVLAFLMPNFYGSPTHHSIFDVFQWAWVPVSTNAGGGAISTTEWGIKNYVEGASYLGILPMLLALVAVFGWISLRVFRKGHPHIAPTLASPLPFAVLAILSLSFVFGTPAYKLLYYGLPFINQSHSPFRWVWPMTLCVAVLAGFGVEYLSPHRDGKPQHVVPPTTRIARWIGWGAIGGGAATLIGLMVVRLFYSRFDGLIERVFTSMAKAPDAFPNAQAFFSYEAANGLLLAIMSILSGVVLLLSRAQKHVSLWQPLAVLVITADLFIPVIGLHPASDPRLLDVVPPSIAWLKEQQAANPNEPFRVMAYQAPDTTKTLNANIAWLHGLEDAGGYDSLIPGQYAEYMKVIMPQGLLPYNRISPLDANQPGALDSPLLDLLGVRYVMSEVEIDNPRWTQAYQDDAVRIYENAGVMPRTFTLPADSTIISAADNPAEGFALLAQQYDYRHHTVVNYQSNPFDALPSDPAVPGKPQPATITNYTAIEITVDVQVEEQSWLVVTNSHFPGWRAWIRPIGTEPEQEVEAPDVYLVNGNFQGVLLEPGEWTVRLKFSSDSFKFGGLASLLVGMAMLFGLGVWGWRYLYRESGEGGDIKRVAKNTITPIVLNLFNKVILFVLTFTQLRILGDVGAGQYRYAFTIWAIFDTVANFGLDAFLMREVARQKNQANKYLVNTTLLRLALVMTGIPVLASFVFARQTFVQPALGNASLWTIGLLYAGLFFSTISYGLTAIFYAHEKVEFSSAVQTIGAFLTTTLGVATLFLGWGIVGLGAVSLIVNGISLTILGTLAVRTFFNTPETRLRWDFDWEIIKKALSESFPLMLNSLLAMLFFRIAVVLLQTFQGDAVVGWYGVIYTWVDMIGVIPALFTLSLFPLMSRQAATDRGALRRGYTLALKLMTLLSVPMAIFTTLLAYFLVNVLGGSQYLPHGAIALQIFIWGMIIGWMNSVTQYVIIAINRQRRLIVAFLVVSIFNIVANLIYIPRYSYPAAAVIAILSEFVLWAMFYIIILRELGRINWLKILWRLAAAGLVTGAVTLWLADVNQWLALAAGVLVYAAMLILLRPFDADEMRTLSGLLPERVKGRLAPKVAEG